MEEKEKQAIIPYLNAIFQNTKTAMQSIKDILPKVINGKLKKELEDEFDEYEKIANKCIHYSKKYSIEMKDNNFFEKAKLWTSIKLTTLTNNETRHITEMMLLGTNMGILTCYKDKFDHRGVSEELDVIIEQLENIEIKNFEKLKPFLNIDESE